MLSLSKTGVKTTHISRVEILLVLFVLLFGGIMVVLIPPGAGYDEEDHLVRVWELSSFSFIPGQLSPQKLKYPTVFRDFAYRQQGSSGVIDTEFLQKYARASLYESGFVRREIDTKSVYSPALLLPQALTMHVLGRSANLPALIVFYGCRFASLVSYLFLVWLALRWIPSGKWILLVLAVAPIALFQAATITPDAISNGIGFLFIAGSLSVAPLEKVGWKEVGVLIVLILLLFLAKLNLLPLILLPFLLIPPARFTRKWIYIFLLTVTLLLFVLEVVGWNAIALSRSTSLMANGANTSAQVAYIIDHPLAFLETLIKDFVTNGFMYFQGWINGYGYYYWTPPLIVSLFFLLGLVAVLLSESTRELVNTKFRIAFLLVFLASYFATAVSLYATFTPVGSDQILGIQGRYFIPAALLLFLIAASFSWNRRLPLSCSKWIVVVLAVALALNVLGIVLAFYVPCGTTFYQTGLCYRPLFKDFPTEAHPSPAIANDISLTQEIQVSCSGLTELRVLAIPSVPGDQGSTRFTLYDAASNQTIVDRSVMNDQITAEDWYSMRFDPDWQSAGKRYVLKILGLNTQPGQGLRILYTTQSEFDLGNLYENGTPVQDDLVLQYGCATGLRKIWLTGRP